jgi:hypothetical protein
MDWLKRRNERKAEEQQARDEAERVRDAAERAYGDEVVEDLGVVAFHRNGSIQVHLGNAAE